MAPLGPKEDPPQLVRKDNWTNGKVLMDIPPPRFGLAPQHATFIHLEKRLPSYVDRCRRGSVLASASRFDCSSSAS
jgi:hypothetical protein